MKKGRREVQEKQRFGNCMESTYVWIMYELLVWKKCMEWYGIDF